MPPGRPDTSPVAYKFGPFRFHGTRRRLYKKGESIALTPKAADTLLALLERSDRVVEKDELLRVVWGDVFVGDDTLAQNISTLRRVLGDEASRPEFIATMPRRGYRFVAPVVALPDEADWDQPETPTAPLPLRHVRAGWAAAAIAVALTGLVAARLWMTEDVRRPMAEFSVAEPEGQRLSASGGALAVSPDGEHLTFVATDAAGTDALWLRPLGAAAYRRLEGTDGAAQPFWSPDSRTIGFFANKRLKAVDVASGALRVVAPLTSARALGATWSRGDEILFSVPGDGMYIVAAAGGAPSRVTPAVDDACSGCSAWPSFLPDGQHFLYTLTPAPGVTAGIYVAALGQSEGQLLIETLSSSAYLAPGFLWFARDGTVYVQPFDSRRLQVTDRPRPIVDGVAFNPRTGRVMASMSDAGVLAFRRPVMTELVRVNRSGAPLSVVGSPAIYMDFSIAPDGQRVAAARVDAHTGTSDVWVVGDGIETRITDAPGWDGNPVWTADGAHVVYSAQRGTRWGIYRRSPNPLSPEELLLDTDAPVTPLQVLPSSEVIFAKHRATESFDLWRLADGKSVALARIGGFYPSDARLSPNATWLAFGRPEAAFGVGRQTVYLSSPSLVSERRIVADAASSPRWRADGRELFYLSQDSSVVAVPLDAAFTPGDVRRNVLFRTTSTTNTGVSGALYDAAPDGGGFVLKHEVGRAAIHVRVNWARP